MKPKQRVKRLFTAREDEHLRKLVATYGPRNWINIASKMKNRSDRQVRERWRYYLDPEAASSPWTPEEDALLNELFDQLGPKWSKIMNFFVNKNRISVKNRWNYLVRNSNKKAKKRFDILLEPSTEDESLNTESENSAESTDEGPKEVPTNLDYLNINIVDESFANLDGEFFDLLKL